MFLSLNPNQVFGQKLTTLLIINAYGNPQLLLVFVFVRPWKTRKTQVDFHNHLQLTSWLSFDRTFDLEPNCEFEETVTSGPEAATGLASGRIVCFCVNPSLSTTRALYWKPLLGNETQKYKKQKTNTKKHSKSAIQKKQQTTKTHKLPEAPSPHISEPFQLCTNTNRNNNSRSK